MLQALVEDALEKRAEKMTIVGERHRISYPGWPGAGDDDTSYRPSGGVPNGVARCFRIATGWALFRRTSDYGEQQIRLVEMGFMVMPHGRRPMVSARIQLMVGTNVRAAWAAEAEELDFEVSSRG